jgi:hypothetical protein
MLRPTPIKSAQDFINMYNEAKLNIVMKLYENARDKERGWEQKEKQLIRRGIDNIKQTLLILYSYSLSVEQKLIIKSIESADAKEWLQYAKSGFQNCQRNSLFAGARYVI